MQQSGRFTQTLWLGGCCWKFSSTIISLASTYVFFIFRLVLVNLNLINIDSQLTEYISPTLMIPQRRLGTLLEQAKAHQRQNCLYHATDASSTLLADCNCDSSSFPALTNYILKDHTDEIWRLEFSHNGEWLATAGRDKTAIIWKIKVRHLFLSLRFFSLFLEGILTVTRFLFQSGFTLDKIFNEHAYPVSCLAWSPDDTILLTAAEAEIKMWNTAARHNACPIPEFFQC